MKEDSVSFDEKENNMTENTTAAEGNITVQEVDTAAINETKQEELPQPKRRQRPKKKSRFVAGQISRLKMAILFLIPLFVVACWTEVAAWLASSGMKNSLVNLPGQYEPVDVRGLLQLLLVGPVLYAGRQFYIQALQDLQERIPSAEVLLLLSTAASVAGGVYTAIQLLLGQPYWNLPPLFLAYTGLCVAAALSGVYLDRWCKAPLPQFLDLPSMWLVSGSILLSIVACLSYFYTGRAT
ncbi:MAG: hypothetical protein IJ056_03540, partial [Acidaminococcaceae bacterium]|nr:hypothetical protein [Acidaminococcaceae bacterium]